MRDLPKPITIIYEDELSGAVIDRILSTYRPDLYVHKRVQCNGCGKIKKNLLNYNKTAKSGFPYFILTDLDTALCAPQLIDEWTKQTPLSSNLFFRVAVREVESWILADRKNLAELLGITISKIPVDTDSIPDPKQLICNLARKSRKKGVREGIPPKDLYAVQGYDYNAILGRFIQNKWNICNAIEYSSSLKRTVERLEDWLKI